MRNYAGAFCSVFTIIVMSSLRLNVHLSSIVSSKPFQMPVEVLPRTGENGLDGGSSRLSSFGFSGTIAHGAFRASRQAKITSVLAMYSLYRRRKDITGPACPRLQVQTHKAIYNAAESDYAEHVVLKLSMQASPSKHICTRKVQEVSSSATCEQSELICAAPGSTKRTDLGALVRVAVACSGSAIHTHALLEGDHTLLVTNDRAKSSSTYYD